jgi:hypothetical protein
VGIQLIGNGGTVVGSGAEAQRGVHVIGKPTDAGALGHYRVAVATGTLAAALAASAQLFQFKWTDATRFAVITSIQARFVTLTRFTAGTITDFGLDAVVARSYATGGGGTTLTLTGDNNQLRAAFGASLATINVSTTAALTAATTLDAQPFAQSMGAFGAQIVPSATIQFADPGTVQLDYAPRMESGEHPLVLAQNEGVVIRNRAVWPAAGTGIYSFTMQWAEVTAF